MTTFQIQSHCFLGVSIILSVLLRRSVYLTATSQGSFCRLGETVSSSGTAELTHFPFCNSNLTWWEVEEEEVWAVHSKLALTLFVSQPL